MKFYLGTHKPHWLGIVDYPLFVSNRTLYERKSFPRAKGDWILDSGGFSELHLFDRWVTKPKRYIELARRYSDEIGNMEYAAIQDWMCEPFMLEKTGLPLKTHQLKTIISYLYLTHNAPDIPWLPVLQGWEQDDYLDHLDQYDQFGVDLTQLPLVGVGSVCRRQNTVEAGEIFESLAEAGISIHGFGVKKTGLKQYRDSLASADSMAWSYRARRAEPLPGHTHQHCNNCIDFASQWRSEVVGLLN